MGCAVAAVADVDGFSFKPFRWEAAKGAVLVDEVFEAAFDVDGHVFEKFGVVPVDDVLEYSAVDAFGGDVVEGVDGVAAAAQVGFVVLGVVDVATETRVFPDNDACEVAAGGGEAVDHGQELVAANDG